MLTPPADLSDDALADALAQGWNVTAAAMDYRPVGFGSHHWELCDAGGSRWFVTVDETSAATLSRLRAALRTAIELRATGCRFVVAPRVTLDSEPLVPVDDRFALALYPYVEGESFAWGEYSTPSHRDAVFDLIVELHTAPISAARHALTDDFTIPHRHDVELSLQPDRDEWNGGPYGTATSQLLADNAETIGPLLARYDERVAETRSRPAPMVVTHGEPHPGNTMLTADGWVLVDWDTVLVAPPERDLWLLVRSDPSIIDAYRDATGRAPSPATLDLYRLRWDLADLAVYVSRFRGRHSDTADDEKAWAELRSLVSRLGTSLGHDIHDHRGDRHGEHASRDAK